MDERTTVEFETVPTGGLRATVPLRPHALFSWLSPRNRATMGASRLPGMALSRPFGFLMALVGAAFVAFPFDVPGKRGDIEDGSILMGLVVMGVPLWVELESRFWRVLRGGELVIGVGKGQVVVARSGKAVALVDAPLEDCVLSSKGNELLVTVKGVEHRWPTACTVRELDRLTQRFAALREAHGTPDSVPATLIRDVQQIRT